jgi:acetyl-CoA carboxylase carboxyl transferase subunit beta
MSMAETKDPAGSNTPPVAPSTGGKPARERGGWLAKIAPGIRNLVTKRDTPENLWVKCPDTGEMIYRPDLEAALWVTPAGRHMRIGPALRFAFTFDEGQYEDLPAPSAPDDPLHFSDGKSYIDRLAAARKSTGEQDAMAIGTGLIGRTQAVVLVQDFAFMGGSLGMAAGEGFIAAAQAALERQCPLVAFTAAGGARMQEGALSLMQMARTTLAIQELKDAGLPYIVVLTDPTTGGVTASYAMLGDVHLAEPGALIGFAGQRVIEQTIRETLPPGFQRSEYLVEKGMVDRVTPRNELAAVLGSILKTLMMGRARL